MLIGDDKQLQSMVESPVCLQYKIICMSCSLLLSLCLLPGLFSDIHSCSYFLLAATFYIAKGAKYGRSLFERLCEIGYRKHSLNVQYRMHPSISRFPNKNFYDAKIIDGPNVNDHYNSCLPGNIYGTYSFIHIEDGMEEHSTVVRVQKIWLRLLQQPILLTDSRVYLTLQLSNSTRR